MLQVGSVRVEDRVSKRDGFEAVRGERAELAGEHVRVLLPACVSC